MKNTQENMKDDSKDPYQQYQELGGMINEKDYQNALDQARSITGPDNKTLIAQAELIADTAGIILHNADGVLDPRIILYGILRTDVNSGAKDHYSKMSDQQIFAEALRMFGDTDSLKRLIKIHPNIFPTTKTW